MNETAIEYVRSKRLSFEIQNGQVVLRICPFCGDEKNHFYMDPAEGIFFCHKCSKRGNLVTLKKHLGDWQATDQRQTSSLHSTSKMAVRQAFPEKNEPTVALNPDRAIQGHQRLLLEPIALAYVTETRGISLEAIDHFKIGFEVDQSGGKWLTIPHFVKGKLLNIKSRSLPPAGKTFRRVQGCPSILFNADVLESAEVIFITEGEIDAITLYDQGIKNVVGVTAGAGSFLPEWFDALNPVLKIFLCYDPDEAGQEGAKEVARRLGYERCFNVLLPDSQDINEYFRAGHGLSDFQALVAGARLFDVAGVMNFPEALRRFEEDIDKKDREGIKTGWIYVNSLIGNGFQPGELVVVSAQPKTGKSTFCLQITTYNAIKNVPVLFFSLEMPWSRVVQKIVQCDTRQSHPGTTEIEKTRSDFNGKPLYIGFSQTAPTLEGVVETIRQAVKRYGLRLIIIDHLHFLVRSKTNVTQEISHAVQTVKFLASEMELTIILVAQPRKVDPDSIMSAQDLRDSSSIFSDCDHLLTMYRRRRVSTGKDVKADAQLKDMSLEPITLIRIEASRYTPGGEALLYYHGEYGRFDAVAPSREDVGR